MTLQLRGIVAAAGVLAAAATLMAPASSASAAPTPGFECGYPYVCFYDGEDGVGKFKDITSGWQTLTRSRGAEYVVNTRHDDGALLHFSNGRTTCVKPGATLYAPSIGAVDKLRITDSAQCRG
ncbi:hypothetical protein [Streptomyces violascens]|uniref:hypothetical protein n=1 Tax=Streptomyces violascens TaxID=67381 RepID=UPI001671BF61|nr:hypothetical protein [Streptomyces violascens]GGU29519.1 hypothetical protein GCM10010289_58560 [Streptomyces violascens]